MDCNRLVRPASAQEGPMRVAFKLNDVIEEIEYACLIPKRREIEV